MAQPALQRYQVTERIDAGGMAEVFKGKVTSLKGFEKQVAIKRILPSLTKDPRFVRMFLDEAKLSLYLNHTNIVQVFDIGQADGTYFIVMEFVDGSNLKNVLNALAVKGRRLPVEMSLFIAMEVCKGLAHAHEKLGPEGQPLQVVHRDISPPNILVSRNGEVKITDFGLAKAVIQLEHTDPGIVKGKFGYLSPEAAWGQPVDLRTDIFAVGILLWEMLAGKRLFLGKTDLKTLEIVREAVIPPLAPHNPEVHPELERILHRALAQDKEHRYASAQAFGQELTRFLFSRGRSVTSYDLSALMGEMLDDKDAPSPVQDKEASKNVDVINVLIQNEIQKFISLEEMADLNELNLVAAKPLTVDDLEGPSATSFPTFGFEDPRTWSDDTLGEEEAALELDLTHSPSVSDQLQANNSGRVAPIERRRPPVAIVEPEPEPAEETSKAAWLIFIVLLVLVIVGLVALIALFLTT